MLGYMNNAGNDIYQNGVSVGLFSSFYSNKNGLSIIKSNFYQTIALFTARKIITGKYANWINDKDNYLKPQEK